MDGANLLLDNSDCGSVLNVSLKVFKKKLKLIWNDIHLAVLHRFNSCVHLATAVVSCDSAYAHIPANLWCIGEVILNSYQYADVFFFPKRGGNAAKWTQADLSAATDIGDDSKCYYALFEVYILS